MTLRIGYVYYGDIARDPLFARLVADLSLGAAPIIAIDNRDPPPYGARRGAFGRVRYQGGDNSCRDVSGFPCALRTWAADADPPADLDRLLLCNSAATWDQVRAVAQAVVAEPRARPLLIGFVDAYPEPVRIGEWTCRSWVRTNAFAVPWGVLQRLDFTHPLGPREVRGAIFGEAGDFFDDPAALLCPRLKAYLRMFLFGEHTPEAGDYRVRWPGAAPLSDANREAMQRKAVSILCEAVATARARALGLEVLDLKTTPPRAAHPPAVPAP